MEREQWAGSFEYTDGEVYYWSKQTSALTSMILSSPLPKSMNFIATCLARLSLAAESFRKFSVLVLILSVQSPSFESRTRSRPLLRAESSSTFAALSISLELKGTALCIPTKMRARGESRTDSAPIKADRLRDVPCMWLSHQRLTSDASRKFACCSLSTI